MYALCSFRSISVLRGFIVEVLEYRFEYSLEYRSFFVVRLFKRTGIVLRFLKERHFC